jgi:hypothetical protein
VVVKEISFKIFMIYMFPASLNMWMWFLGCHLSSCMYVYITMCSLLAPEQLDILFIFATGTHMLVQKRRFHFIAPN